MISAFIKAMLRDKLGESMKLKIRGAIYSPLAFRDLLFFSLQGVKSHHSWRVWGLPVLQLHSRGAFSAGIGLTLCSKPQHNSLGVCQPCVIKTLTPEARIVVGANVGISGSTLSARVGITIGDNVLIGSGVLVTDNDSHPVDHKKRHDAASIMSAPVSIGDNAFVGARSIILKGVSVAPGSLVGAGSVLTRSTEPNSVYAGNPARLIRTY